MFEERITARSIDCYFFLLIFLAVVKAHEIDLLDDQKEDSAVSLLRDPTSGETMYCRYKETHTKFYANANTRHHLFTEMKNHDFTTTAELKFGKSTGNGEHTLLSMEGKNHTTLFRWWVNIRRSQVGVAYMGQGERQSSVVFEKVGLDTGGWIQLMLNFRDSEKGWPLVELFLNWKLIATKRLNRPIRAALKKTTEDHVKVLLADREFRSFKHRGKVCMRRVKVFTNKHVADILNNCKTNNASPKSPRERAKAVTKEHLIQLERSIADKITATYHQTVQKMIEEMQTMLSNCGLCHQNFTRIPETTFKTQKLSENSTVNDTLKTFTKKPKTISHPPHTSANITLKSLIRDPPTTPNISRTSENDTVKYWLKTNPTPSQTSTNITVKGAERNLQSMPKTTPTISRTSETVSTVPQTSSNTVAQGSTRDSPTVLKTLQKFAVNLMVNDQPKICPPGQNSCKTTKIELKRTLKPPKILANVAAKDWGKICRPGQKICRIFTRGPKNTLKTTKSTKMMLKDRRKVCSPGQNNCHSNAKCIPSKGSGQHHCKCNIGYAGSGYMCGLDADLDGFPDEGLPCKEKNCKKDNCPRVRNQDQKDTDNNGIGDSCSKDFDGDGYITSDTCPYVSNRDQKDSDADKVGDVCDNCPLVFNPDQMDKDMDLVGDACGTNFDRDNDGVNDVDDNCLNVTNPGQLDTDRDGKGDECDSDDDNDGVPDEKDNCRLTANKDQKDSRGTGVGDACQSEFDGDLFLNNQYSCPENNDFSDVNFLTFETVNLDPKGRAQIDPVWKVRNKGKEIMQLQNSDPGLAVGNQSFGDLDYIGTIFVDTDADNDFIGLVFGYQSSSKFYAVMWKKSGQVYWHREPFVVTSKTGLSIKVINSSTGPGPQLRNALWSSKTTRDDQVKVLWRDTNRIGWMGKRAYRWVLKHRPKTGYIRLKIFDGANVIIDSGALNDKTHPGGRVGVLVFSQEKVIWSNAAYRCNDDAPDDEILQ